MPITFCMVLSIAVLVIASVLTALSKVELGTLWILAITAVAVLWYALETFLLRKETEKTTKLNTEANTFNTLTAVHRQLMSQKSRSNRYLVINHLQSVLANVVSQTIDSIYVAESGPNHTVLLERVLNEMEKDDVKAGNFLAAFNPGQQSDSTAVLTAPEEVLDDFNLLAVPCSLGILAVKVAAEQYKPVLKKTARPLLTFVAIRRRLTGDSTYRSHYVSLLRELKIDTLGVA